MKLKLTCISFQPLCRRSLRGFADIRVEQMRISDAVIAAVLEFNPSAVQRKEALS